jgi:hypothetical protein
MKYFVKQLCFVLSLALCLSFLAACGAPAAEVPNGTPVPPPSETPGASLPPSEPEPTPEPSLEPEPEPEPTPEPSPDPEPEPIPVVDEAQFRSYVFLCKALGAFGTPEEVSGAAFFQYYRYRMEYETEEEPAVSSTGKEYVRTIHIFDLNVFDAISTELFGTVFDYSAVPAELNSNLFQYEYDAETHTIREIIDGMGAGGGSGVEYYARYEGYTTEDNEFYQLHYSYVGTTDYGEREFETDVTGIVYVQYVEGDFRIQSHEIHGELTYEAP